MGFLFHQSDMVGSAILFGNATCTEATQHVPPEPLQGAFAVTFVAAKKEYAEDCIVRFFVCFFFSYPILNIRRALDVLGRVVRQ